MDLRIHKEFADIREAQLITEDKQHAAGDSEEAREALDIIEQLSEMTRQALEEMSAFERRVDENFGEFAETVHQVTRDIQAKKDAASVEQVLQELERDFQRANQQTKDDLHRLLQYIDKDMQKERGSREPEGEVRPTTERSVGTRTKPDPRDVTVTENAPHKVSDLYLEKYQKETSPLLEVVAGAVVYQAVAKYLHVENQALTERDEAKRELDRKRMARQREEDREAYNAQRRQYMREWRARKKQEAQSHKAQEPKRNNT